MTSKLITMNHRSHIHISNSHWKQYTEAWSLKNNPLRTSIFTLLEL